ncbi:MAG: hypothetical protein V7606_4133 [Burkholderiales bacterium]
MLTHNILTNAGGRAAGYQERYTAVERFPS